MPPQQLKKVFLTNGTPQWGNDIMFSWKQDSKQMISAIYLVLQVESVDRLRDPEDFLNRVQLNGKYRVINNISAALLAAIPYLRITKTETEYRLRLPFGFDRAYFPESQPLCDMPPDASVVVQLAAGIDTKLETARIEIELETAPPRNSYKTFANMKFKYSGKENYFSVSEYKNLEAIMVRASDQNQPQVEITKFGESQDHVFKLLHVNQWIRFEVVTGVPVDSEELVIHVTHAGLNTQDRTLDVVYEMRVTE